MGLCIVGLAGGRQGSLSEGLGTEEECLVLWPKQTAAVRTAAVCIMSPLLIYKLLRSGCGQVAVQVAVQAAVRLRFERNVTLLTLT